MRDHEIDKLLSEMPREQASESFTEEVLARVETEPARTRPAVRGPVWALAAAALLAALLGAVAWNTLPNGQAPALANDEPTLEEVETLLAELDALREESAAPVVIQVAGDEPVGVGYRLSPAAARADNEGTRRRTLPIYQPTSESVIY